MAKPGAVRGQKGGAVVLAGVHSGLQCTDVCVAGMKTDPFRKTSLVGKLTHIEGNPFTPIPI